MNQNNFAIIMAGGYGSRFWPMSNYTNPKQFIDIFGTGQTMLQTSFRRLEKVCPRENIIIVTTKGNAERVRQQVPDLLDYQVLSEPLRRNTAPCVAYAAAVVNELNPNANIIVSPSDHAIFNEELFIKDLNDAIDITDKHDWIVTMGTQPNNPNTKYGYIQYAEAAALADVTNVHKVVTFTEKPPVEMAVQFISSGEFFWNAGIFVWRLPVLMDAYRRHLPAVAESFFNLSLDTPPAELARVYSAIEPISIDFGIMEKADNGYVMESDFTWSDVETWESLFATCPKDENNNAIATGNVLLYNSHDCVVHMPSMGTVILQGLDNYIVTANDSILMICRRDQEENIPKFASDYELYKDRKK